MSELRDLLARAISGETNRPRIAISSLAGLTSGKNPKISESLMGMPPRESDAKPNDGGPDADLAAADALIDGVADRLEAEDAEKLRGADRETKLRFAKRLLNSRELNAEREQRQAAAAAEAKAVEAVQENNRLASLGATIGKAEGGK